MFSGLFRVMPMQQPPRSTRSPSETDPPAASLAPTGELTFEEALAELEQIVRSMEEGHLALNESLAAYQRGSELLRQCRQQLSDAERRIQILDDGILRDFDTVGDQQP